MEENTRVLFYLKYQIGRKIKKISELKSKYEKSGSFEHYKELFLYMRNIISIIVLPKVKINN